MLPWMMGNMQRLARSRRAPRTVRSQRCGEDHQPCPQKYRKLPKIATVDVMPRWKQRGPVLTHSQVINVKPSSMSSYEPNAKLNSSTNTPQPHLLDGEGSTDSVWAAGPTEWRCNAQNMPRSSVLGRSRKHFVASARSSCWVEPRPFQGNRPTVVGRLHGPPNTVGQTQAPSTTSRQSPWGGLSPTPDDGPRNLANSPVLQDQDVVRP